MPYRHTLLTRTCAAALLGALLLTAGCTSRGLTVTSEPPGAELSINRRVVGKTPLRVGFNHYGTYRIELRKEGFKVMVKEEPVRPPIYGYDPVAAVADNLVPARLNDEVFLHYALEPLDLKKESKAGSATADRDALLARAIAARSGSVTLPTTGEAVAIKLDRIPAPQPDETLAAAGMEEDILVPRRDARTVASGETPLAAAGPQATIDDQPSLAKPRDASLAQEFGLVVPVAPAPAKPAASALTQGGSSMFSSPDAQAKPAVIRTPREEILIYQAPKKDAPQGGKKKEDGKKEAAEK